MEEVENTHTHAHTQHLQAMKVKYDREWEPVYQAFLLLPLVQVAPSTPVRDQKKNTHKHKKTVHPAVQNI